MKKLIFLGSLFVMVGCQSSVLQIPGIPESHPAQDFYRFVSQNPVSDKVCIDHQGDPSIPAGKVVDGEGYRELKQIVPGVFRFEETSTGKCYLGVNYLQYQGFLQIPKICSWEEEKKNR